MEQVHSRGWRGGQAVFFLREYLFPQGCAVCGAALASAGEAWLGLCGNCQAYAEDAALAGSRCGRCGRPLVSEQGRCLSCRGAGERPIDQVLALFPYAGKCRSLLRAYKFGKHAALGNFFAGKVRDALESPVWETALAGAALVPVPPRPGKIKAAGWDQIEYLAKALESGRGGAAVPISRCLRRLRSGAQKELSREERLRNLHGKIRLVKPAPKTAVVFDDVITTGSTLDACASVLKAGGAERVCGICLFYD